MNGAEWRTKYLRQRRAKNIALLIVLVALVVIFFAVTIVRLGEHAIQP